MGNISVNSFHRQLTPCPSPNRKWCLKNIILKGLEGQKASRLQVQATFKDGKNIPHALMKSEMLWVRTKHAHSSSSLVPKNGGP